MKWPTSSQAILFATYVFCSVALLRPTPSLAQTTALTYRPIAAEYSSALDRIIMLSASPDQVHIYDAASHSDTAVNLPKSPLSLSVSPDGLHAAVGHDALISYVNLTSANVEKTLAIPVKAQTITMNSSWIYVMPAYEGDSVSVNIGTGAVTPNSSVFYASGGRFDAAVNSIYGTRDGISPNDIEKYDISTGPITAQTDSIYHGDFPVCGPVFFSTDGLRIYDGCSTVFRASTDSTLDMRYVTTLAGAASVRSLTESALLHRVALIPGSSSYYTVNPVNDGVVLLYESAYLTPLGQFALADFAAGSASFRAHGRWVFYNASSTALYAITQADPTASLLNDFAVQTIPVGTPSACGAYFGAASANVTGSGSLGTVNVIASQQCQYQAVSDSPWLQIVSGGYGSGNGVLTYIVRANAGGARSGTISIAGITLVITQDGAPAASSFNPLAYNVVAAAYDKPLDKMVLVSANPNELHIYDPVTQADQFVPLLAPPLSVSVGPDGSFAAVGHDGFISYVNLQTAAVMQTYQVAMQARYLALAGNGYVYAWPFPEIFPATGSLRIDSGIMTPAQSISFDGVLRLYADGKTLYAGYSGITRYDISQGVAVLVPSQPYNASNSCGNIWLTEDGNRLFTACAQAFRTSPVVSEDLQYNGQLAGLNSLTWADESVLQHSTVVIPKSFGGSAPDDTQLQIFGDAFLGYAGSLPLPQFTAGGQSFAGHGQFVFWNTAATKLFVVEQADATAKFSSAYAVSVVAPSTGADGCTIAVQQSIVNVPFGGGFNSIGLTAGSACAWTSVSNSPWITISAGSFGFGSGTVSISATANDSGANRAGTVTIAGTSVTVTQAVGACTFSLSTTSVSIAAQGDANTFNVTSTAGCGWSANSNVPWLTITSGGSAIGSGTVYFSLSPNPGSLPRSGVITAAGLTITVTQAGSAPRALAQVAAGSGLTTGFFILNTGSAPAQFLMNYYDDNGNPAALPFATGAASTISGTLPAQGSAYYETTNPQGPLVFGWGQIISDSAIVVHALFRNNTNGSYQEAAVPSAPAAHEILLPFDSTTFAATGQSFVTGIAIANLDTSSAYITCTARDPNGAVIPSAVPVPLLAPLGHWSSFQFPALAGQRGTIDCLSNTNISATALRFIGTSGTFSSLPVVANPAGLTNGSPNNGALAQVAAGGGLITGFLVLNASSAPSQFSINVYDDNGNPAALPFASGAASTISGTIPAQGSAYYETSNPEGPLVAGWGQITADPAIVIQALFRSSNAKGIYHEAAVPSTSGSTEFLIPFDASFFPATGQFFATGIAIANTAATNANITCTARNPNGAVIANAFPVPAFAPLGHWASFQFPALNGQRGTIDCVSNTKASATVLHFMGTSGTLSTLPVVTK